MAQKAPKLVKLPEFDPKGKKLFQQRAVRAFPKLVRQAKAEQPITYSALAQELGMPKSKEPHRRGLYQSVKYSALMEARLRVEQNKISSKVILVLGGALPESLRAEKDLSVECRVGVSVPPNFEIV